MNFVLFDEEVTWKSFLPFTFTRPVSEIRFGILTIREKWEAYLGTTCSYHTQSYLGKKYPLHASSESVFIISNCCPDPPLVAAVKKLKGRQALYYKETLVAFGVNSMEPGNVNSYERIDHQEPVMRINHLWEIFSKNDAAVKSDFRRLTSGKSGIALDPSATVIGERDQVFMAPGAVAMACIFNTTGGPIYIGRDAEVMEGSVVRGPFALGEHSTLKMGAKVYGATTIGPHCKVGGEVSNSVIFGYSNKAHDGFLGNSVIGEWCNLGADTNNSNLKNNYGQVKLFSYALNKQVDTGLQFCGLLMADHSKAGINTMFNTGTVVGVGCNIYGGGFPPTAIPNFSWGGKDGFSVYELPKLFETATRVFERRGLTFNETEMTLLRNVFEGTV